ncbi:MAG: hypothetical protein GY679_02165 [Mycoplasma sp.]|nr:hypothetical protein [Mycoplasma sp.]
MTKNAEIVYEFILENKKAGQKFPILKEIMIHAGINRLETKDALKEVYEARLIKKIDNGNGSKRYVYKTRLSATKRKEYEEVARAKSIGGIESDVELKNIKTMLRWFSLAVGIILSGLSIYFTWNFLKDGVGSVVGMLASISIVGVLVVAYQIILILRVQRKILQAILFGLVFVTALTISVSSTIFTQVNGVLENRRELNMNNSKNDYLVYEEIQKEVSELENEFKSLKEERTKLKEFLNSFTKVDKQYKEVNYRIHLKNNAVEAVRVKLEQKREELKSALKGNINLDQETELEVYTWIEKLTGIDKSVFEIILSIAFAIFIDVTAPLMMSVAIIVKKRG